MSTESPYEYKTDGEVARRSYAPILLFLLVLTLLITLPLYMNSPSPRFSTEATITIPEGSSLTEIGHMLKEGGYVRSSLFFRVASVLLGEDASLKAGTYKFESPAPTLAVVEALAEGDALSSLVPYTFPEGFSVRDMGIYTDGWFAGTDIAAIAESEGLLFPDTYFVSPNETPSDLVTRMKEEFDEKLAPYTERIEESGYTREEVIILASILEREANDETSMRTVAGILENRLEEGIPLQVDATLTYLLGKTSAELTVDDLTLDSPYNTYTNAGLPPHPIANPGLMAIEAVLEPIQSSYLYYLTGNDGKFYYARTFEEHKRNKERYLR